MKRWLLILEILLGVGVLFGTAFWASDRVLDYLIGDVYQRAAVAEARATAAEVARLLDGEREAVVTVARSLAEQPVLQDPKAEPDALSAALGRVKDQLGDARALIVNGKVQVKDHDFSLTKLPCTKTAEGGAECVQFIEQDKKGLLAVAEPLPKGQGALLVLQPLSPRMAAWMKSLSPGAVAALIRGGAVLASSQPLVGYNPASTETQRVGRDDHVSFKLKWSPKLELVGLAPVGMARSSAEQALQIVFLALGGATLLMMLLFVLTQPYPKAMRQAVEPPVAPTTGEFDAPPSAEPAAPELPVPPLAAASKPPTPSQQPALSHPAIALASQPTADPIPPPPEPALSTPEPARSAPPVSAQALAGSGFSDPPGLSSIPSLEPSPASSTQSMGPMSGRPAEAEVRSAFDAIADAAFASAPPPVAHSVGPVPGDLPIPKGGLSPEVAQASVNQRHTDLPQPKSSSSLPARPSSFGGSLNPSGLPVSVSTAIPLPGQGTGALDDGSSSEAHYREVYESFVAAKRRQGESVDRIQLEGFSAKLRKSEQALINKHKCKAVRFQVIEKGNSVSLRPQLIR